MPCNATARSSSVCSRPRVPHACPGNQAREALRSVLDGAGRRWSVRAPVVAELRAQATERSRGFLAPRACLVGSSNAATSRAHGCMVSAQQGEREGAGGCGKQERLLLAFTTPQAWRPSGSRPNRRLALIQHSVQSGDKRREGPHEVLSQRQLHHRERPMPRARLPRHPSGNLPALSVVNDSTAAQEVFLACHHKIRDGS